jgi:plasmid stabilization system protein ParE
VIAAAHRAGMTVDAYVAAVCADALDDVARRYDFLALVGPSAVQHAACVIKAATDMIADNPHIGLPHAEFREWPEQFGRGAYVLRYHILTRADVLITRVWHRRELLQN